MAGSSLDTQAHGSTDHNRLADLGYRQELSRVLSLFDNFSISFSYLSPMVGVYSLFVLGVGAGGPRYLWLMLPVVARNRSLP